MSGGSAAGRDATVRRYRGHFAAHDEPARAARRAASREIVVDYYDLATDFYLRGWGRSFHFAPRRRGESLAASLARFERELAAPLGLAPGVRAVDLGCGVGGPLAHLAAASGASLTGVNINAGQVALARRFLDRAGLAGRCTVVEGDFQRLPFAAGSFDAAYSLEALCHAADRRAAFAEARRVLVPGGLFAASDWCLTDRYDDADPRHRALRADVELGNGLPALATAAATRRDLEAAGFEVLRWRDAASEGEVAWYAPLAGGCTPAQFLRGPTGRRLVTRLLRGAEAIGLVRRGTAGVQEFLAAGAEALVAAGVAGIFTPLACWLARKPR